MEARVATLPDGRIMAGTTWSGGVTLEPVRGRRPARPEPLDQARPPQGVLRPTVDFSAGPRGVFMVERTTARLRKDLADTPPLYLRTFDLKRNRWSRASGIFADRGGPYDDIRAAQDASGRLHVLTLGRRTTCCLMYSRTGTKRRSGFGKTNVLVRRGAAAGRSRSSPVAPDGGGAAVWQEHDRTADGRASGRRRCRRRRASTGRSPRRAAAACRVAARRG